MTHLPTVAFDIETTGFATTTTHAWPDERGLATDNEMVPSEILQSPAGSCENPSRHLSVFRPPTERNFFPFVAPEISDAG